MGRQRWALPFGALELRHLAVIDELVSFVTRRFTGSPSGFFAAWVWARRLTQTRTLRLALATRFAETGELALQFLLHAHLGKLLAEFSEALPSFAPGTVGKLPSSVGRMHRPVSADVGPSLVVDPAFRPPVRAPGPVARRFR